MNWSESREYKNALGGEYLRTPEYYGRAAGNGSSSTSNSATASPSSGPVLIRCPHCGRDQANERFCSLCGGAIS